VKTLDLNQEFEDIRQQLMYIVGCFDGRAI
jgi:hypothetical protein